MRLPNFFKMSPNHVMIGAFGLGLLVSGIIHFNMGGSQYWLIICFIGINCMSAAFCLDIFRRMKEKEAELEAKLQKANHETDRYFIALANTSNIPIHRDYETEEDLPYVGVQNVVYHIQSSNRYLMYNGHSYVEEESWITDENRAHERLENARRLVEQWNQNYSFRNDYRLWEQTYSTTYMPNHEILGEPPMQQHNEAEDDWPPTEESPEETPLEKENKKTVQKPQNRLKNIFGGNHV